MLKFKLANPFVLIHRNFLLISSLNLYCHILSTKFKQDQFIAFYFVTDFNLFEICSHIFSHFFLFPLQHQLFRFLLLAIFSRSLTSHHHCFSQDCSNLSNFQKFRKLYEALLLGLIVIECTGRITLYFYSNIKSAASVESQTYVF